MVRLTDLKLNRSNKVCCIGSNSNFWDMMLNQACTEVCCDYAVAALQSTSSASGAAVYDLYHMTVQLCFARTGHQFAKHCFTTEASH